MLIGYTLKNMRLKFQLETIFRKTRKKGLNICSGLTHEEN